MCYPMLTCFRGEQGFAFPAYQSVRRKPQPLINDFKPAFRVGQGFCCHFRGDILDTHSASSLWTAALGQLEVQIPRPSFETWLKNTSAIVADDGALVISTPNTFTAEMLEQRLAEPIERVVEQVANEPMPIRFAVKNDSALEFASADSERQPGEAEDDEQASPKASRSGRSRFNPDYTFANYVEGPSNQLAYAAAQRVAESPGSAFNPLYLYSGVGLGKTHLLHAIGHELSAKGMAVKYVNAERFTNEYIRSIPEKSTEKFRKKYRNVDALLIDDVQFISNKPSTQDAFFHTFNELHMAGKQVVISGDLPAEKINLEQRIQSRLSGGLVVDIQLPDYETRYAIVQGKSASRGIDMPKEVTEILAGMDVDSVRELEGALNRVLAFADLTRAPITVDLAEKALVSIGSHKPIQFPEPSAVISAVSAHTGVPESSITGRKRDRRTSSARRLAAFLLREESKLTASNTGQALGGKDHSSILYALKKFEEEHDNDAGLRKLTSDVRNALR